MGEKREERDIYLNQKSRERERKNLTKLRQKTLGLRIYAAGSNKFFPKMTYEELLEGIRAGKYKMTYTEKQAGE